MTSSFNSSHLRHARKGKTTSSLAKTKGNEGNAQRKDVSIVLQDTLLPYAGHTLEIICDGEVKRFDTQDKPRGNQNGWYIVHSPEAATYGIWHLDLSEDVFAGTTSWLSVQERHAMAQKAREDIFNRYQEKSRREKMAAEKAAELWHRSVIPDGSHAYLKRKHLPAYNLRQLGNTLLMPIYCGAALVNLERIYPDGKKRTLPGGKVKGCYSRIGHLTGMKEIMLAEGWSTAATLHRFYGLPVFIARNADNLENVARNLRHWAGDEVSIIVCADDDRHLVCNKGMEKAQQAARLINAKLMVPSFCKTCPRCTDFCDVALCQGGWHEQ